MIQIDLVVRGQRIVGPSSLVSLGFREGVSAEAGREEERALAEFLGEK
jgi:hypothetical protein